VIRLTSSVTRFVTPRMLRFPWIARPEPRDSALVETKRIQGEASLSKNSGLRRRASRISLCVSIEATANSTLTLVASGCAGS
jgi:hypothetical protein